MMSEEPNDNLSLARAVWGFITLGGLLRRASLQEARKEARKAPLRLLILPDNGRSSDISYQGGCVLIIPERTGNSAIDHETAIDGV